MLNEATIRVLTAKGCEVVVPDIQFCCGSAGRYNGTQTKASFDLLTEKMAFAKSTNAQIIATANPGCLLQLRAGVKIHRTGQEVLHVIEMLDRASANSST